jgi:dolichol-phosphate mannosyltransferase
MIVSHSLISLFDSVVCGEFIVSKRLTKSGYSRLLSGTAVGWTLLFIGMLFLGGVQLLFLGVMGEYLGRIYGEVKRRPLYLVKERLGFQSASQSTVDAEAAGA